MPHVLTKTAYNFDELSDRAKETARQWYREGAFDYAWWDAVYDDAAECAEIIGIDLRVRQRQFMNGTKDQNGIAIFFSGFWSQGDGACFEGRYEYAKGASKRIREHASIDQQLHRIADELQELQQANFYRLTATMKHRGHYSHSGCMEVSVDDGERRGKDWVRVEETLTQLMRDFADWIYKQLEKEYDYLNSDEQVDESIRVNEYDFDENGNRCC